MLGAVFLKVVKIASQSASQTEKKNIVEEFQLQPSEKVCQNKIQDMLP